MYVTINENYTATVRCLRSFRNHLNRESESFDHKFGKVTYTKSTTNPRFIRIVNSLISKKRSDLRTEAENNVLLRIGDTGEIHANQGLRDYTIVSACRLTGDLLIEYTMPMGTSALRILKADGGHKNFTYKQLTNSRRFRKHLKEDLLVNKPQSGHTYNNIRYSKLYGVKEGTAVVLDSDLLGYFIRGKSEGGRVHLKYYRREDNLRVTNRDQWLPSYTEVRIGTR